MTRPTSLVWWLGTLFGIGLTFAGVRTARRRARARRIDAGAVSDYWLQQQRALSEDRGF
jgi:hypothetical protein